jgi:hypothetical protein
MADSKKESELRQLRKLNKHAARPATGLASQIYGLDEKGKAKLGATPGLVNEIISLPTLLPALSWLAARLGSGPGGPKFPGQAEFIEEQMQRLVPGASREAEKVQEELRQAVREEAGLKAPVGFVEGAEDALGTMLGQLPIGGAKKLGTGARAVRAFPEYVLPTVRPSVGAYTSGTLGGGALNALADEAEEPKAQGGYMSPVPRQRFAIGGLAHFLKKYMKERANRVSITMQPQGRMRNDALMLSPSDYMNYGTGPAQSFYSNMQGGSQAMSPFAQTDKKVGHAMKDLGRLTQKMAEGGKVAVSQKGLAAIKEAISHLQGRDRARAVETLRRSREALAHPGASEAHRVLATDSGIGPATRVLNKLVEEAGNTRGVPTLAEGGEVDSSMQDANPSALYAEYVQLVEQLEGGAFDEAQQAAAITRLEQIEQALEALGIDVVGDDAMMAEDEGGGMAI